MNRIFLGVLHIDDIFCTRLHVWICMDYQEWNQRKTCGRVMIDYNMVEMKWFIILIVFVTTSIYRIGRCWINVNLIIILRYNKQKST